MTPKSNNNSVFSISYHIVWCPKYRRGILVNDIKQRLETIIKEACRDNYLTINTMSVMPDYVELMLSATPKISPNKVVKAIKGRTSNVLRKEFPELLKMPTLWSGSFFISTIGNASQQTIEQYINNQWNK